jgi:hypothetical protein
MSDKKRKPSKRAQKVSLMLGLVPTRRPANDPIRRKAEKLIPIVRRVK